MLSETLDNWVYDEELDWQIMLSAITDMNFVGAKQVALLFNCNI